MVGRRAQAFHVDGKARRERGALRKVKNINKMPKYTKYAKICKNTQKCAKYAKICKNMQTYTKYAKI